MVPIVLVRNVNIENTMGTIKRVIKLLSAVAIHPSHKALEDKKLWRIVRSKFKYPHSSRL